MPTIMLAKLIVPTTALTTLLHIAHHQHRFSLQSMSSIHGFHRQTPHGATLTAFSFVWASGKRPHITEKCNLREKIPQFFRGVLTALPVHGSALILW